jgi:Flp pilus assembly pilin Flp
MSFSDYFSLIKLMSKRQEGQTMAEYAVVLAVITLAVVGIFAALGTGIGGKITDVTNAI